MRRICFLNNYLNKTLCKILIFKLIYIYLTILKNKLLLIHGCFDDQSDKRAVVKIEELHLGLLKQPFLSNNKLKIAYLSSAPLWSFVLYSKDIADRWCQHCLTRSGFRQVFDLYRERPINEDLLRRFDLVGAPILYRIDRNFGVVHDLELIELLAVLRILARDLLDGWDDLGLIVGHGLQDFHLFEMSFFDLIFYDFRLVR